APVLPGRHGRAPARQPRPRGARARVRRTRTLRVPLSRRAAPRAGRHRLAAESDRGVLNRPIPTPGGTLDARRPVPFAIESGRPPGRWLVGANTETLIDRSCAPSLRKGGGLVRRAGQPAGRREGRIPPSK